MTLPPFDLKAACIEVTLERAAEGATMTDRCAICERSDRPLSQHGPNLVCASCTRDQDRNAEIAERLGRVAGSDQAWVARGEALVRNANRRFAQEARR